MLAPVLPDILLPDMLLPVMVCPAMLLPVILPPVMLPPVIPPIVLSCIVLLELLPDAVWPMLVWLEQIAGVAVWLRAIGVRLVRPANAMKLAVATRVRFIEWVPTNNGKLAC